MSKKDIIKTGYMGCTFCHGSRYPDGEHECKHCKGSGEEIGVSLKWLQEQIKNEEKRLMKENELHCYSIVKGLNIVLSLSDVKE